MSPLAPVPPAPDASRARTHLATGLAVVCALATLPFASVSPGAALGIELAAVVSALAAILVQRTRRTPVPRVAWIALAAVAGIVALGILQLATGTTAPPSTVDALARFGAYGLFFFAACVAAGPGVNLRGAAIVLVAIGAFQGLYGAFEYLSGRQHIFGFAKKFYVDEATGTFINRNHYAGYLAAVLPFALALTLGEANGGTTRGPTWRGRLERIAGRRAIGRVAAGTGAAAIWLGVLLSQSRAGLAVAGASTLVFAWLASRNRARWGWMLAVGVVPLAFLLLRDVRTPGERFFEDGTLSGSGETRIVAWNAATSRMTERPWLGWGLGAFEPAFEIVQPGDLPGRWDHLHSDVLQGIFEGGAAMGLALIVGAAALVAGARRVDSARNGAGGPIGAAAVAAVFALVLHAGVDFPLRIPASSALLALTAGFVIALDRMAINSAP